MSRQGCMYTTPGRLSKAFWALGTGCLILGTAQLRIEMGTALQVVVGIGRRVMAWAGSAYSLAIHLNAYMLPTCPNLNRGGSRPPGVIGAYPGRHWFGSHPSLSPPAQKGGMYFFSARKNFSGPCSSPPTISKRPFLANAFATSDLFSRYLTYGLARRYSTVLGQVRDGAA